MHDQATALPSAPTQALRHARYAVVEDHYRPVADDVEEDVPERWLYVADDRGESHLSTHATFEDLCTYAAGEVLDSGMTPVTAYDLDAGRPVELHITTPVVSVAEEQDVYAHPDLTGAR